LSQLARSKFDRAFKRSGKPPIDVLEAFGTPMEEVREIPGEIFADIFATAITGQPRHVVRSLPGLSGPSKRLKEIDAFEALRGDILGILSTPKLQNRLRQLLLRAPSGQLGP